MAMWCDFSRAVRNEADRWTVQSVSQCVSLRVTMGFWQWQCLFLLMLSLMVSSRAPVSTHPQAGHRSTRPETHSALLVLPLHKTVGILTTPPSAKRIQLSFWAGYAQLPKWKLLSKVTYGPFQLSHPLSPVKSYNQRIRKLSKRDLWNAAPLLSVQSLLGLESTKMPYTPEKDWNLAVKGMIEQIFGGGDNMPVKSGVLKSLSSNSLSDKPKLQLGSLRNWNVFRRQSMTNNEVPMARSSAIASFSTPTDSFKSTFITKAVSPFIQTTSVKEPYSKTVNIGHRMPEVSFNQGMLASLVTQQSSTGNLDLENMTDIPANTSGMSGFQELTPSRIFRLPPLPVTSMLEHNTSILQKKISGMQELVKKIPVVTSSHVPPPASLRTHAFPDSEHSMVSFDESGVEMTLSTQESKVSVSSLTSSQPVSMEQTINSSRDSEHTFIPNVWEHTDFGGSDETADEIQALPPLTASSYFTSYSQTTELNTPEVSVNHKFHTLPTVAVLDGTRILSTYSRGPTSLSSFTRSEQMNTHSDHFYGIQVADTRNPLPQDDWNPPSSHVTTKSIKSFTSFGIEASSIKALNKTNGLNRSITEKSTVLMENSTSSHYLNHSSQFPIYGDGSPFASSVDPPAGYSTSRHATWDSQSSSTSTSQTFLTQSFQGTPNTKDGMPSEEISSQNKTEAVSSTHPSFHTTSTQIPLHIHSAQPQELSSMFPHTISDPRETNTIVNKDLNSIRFDHRWFSSQTATSTIKSAPSEASSQPYNTNTDVLFKASVGTVLDATAELSFSSPLTSNVSFGFRIPKRHRPSCSHSSVSTILPTHGTSVDPTSIPVVNASPHTSKSTATSAFQAYMEKTARAQPSVTKILPLLSSIKLATSQHSTVSHTRSQHTSPVFSPETTFNITVSGLKPKMYSAASEPSTIDLKTNTGQTGPSYFASSVSKIHSNSTEADKISLGMLTSFSPEVGTNSKHITQMISKTTEVPLTTTYAEIFSASQSDDPLVERGGLLPPPTMSSVVTIPLIFSLTGILYNDQLQNSSSEEYKKLEREVELVLNKIFSTQYRSDYLQSKVKNFLNGSVIVLTEVEFHAQSPAPSGSNIVRTLLTSNWKKPSNFGWNINASSVESNGHTLKNLEPECLSLYLLVLHVGFVAVSGNYKENKIFLDTLKQEINRSVGVLFPVKNVFVSRIRDLRGDLEVVGNLYLDTQVHTNVPVLLNTLFPLANISVDLSSIVIEGYRMDLQVFPISFRIINMKFSLDLLDLSSSDFKALSKNVSAVVKYVLQVYDPYQVIIREFRRGSVICKGNLMFRLPAPGSGEVLRTILNSLGTSDKLGSSSYKVERSTLNVADSTPGVHFEYANFPGFAVAIIVMCGLAILIFPALAYMCVKTRMLGHRNKATIQRRHDPDTQSHHFELDNRAFRATIEQP